MKFENSLGVTLALPSWTKSNGHELGKGEAPSHQRLRLGAKCPCDLGGTGCCLVVSAHVLISHYLRVNAFLWQRSGSRWSAGFKGYGYRPSQSMGKGRRDPAVGFKASVGTRLILLLSLCKQCQITTTYKLIFTRYRFLFGTATWEVVQSCSNHSLHGMTYPMTLPTPFPLCQGSEDRPIRLQRYLGSQCQTAFPCDQGAWFSCFDTHPWSPCPKLLWLLRDHDWKIHGSQLVHFFLGGHVAGDMRYDL